MRRAPSSRHEFAFRAPARRGRAGVVLSLLVHAALVALLLIPLGHDFQRVLDPGRLGGRAAGGSGGGGSRETYISLPAPAQAPRAEVEVTPPARTPPPVAVAPEPVPTPTTEPVVPPPEPVTEPPVAVVTPPDPAVPASATTTGAASVAGSGPGQGGGAGGGTGGGIGPGVGPGTGPGTGDSGSAGRGRPARPRHQVLPALDDVPKDYRGKEIRVVFAIDATGKVRSVTFDPPIADGKFRDRLRETMLAYRFHPALDPAGTPIPSSYTQSVTY
jgi:protein TonB